jgi:hypothetical protein
MNSGMTALFQAQPLFLLLLAAAALARWMRKAGRR